MSSCTESAESRSEHLINSCRAFCSRYLHTLSHTACCSDLLAPLLLLHAYRNLCQFASGKRRALSACHTHKVTAGCCATARPDKGQAPLQWA